MSLLSQLSMEQFHMKLPEHMVQVKYLYALLRKVPVLLPAVRSVPFWNWLVSMIFCQNVSEVAHQSIWCVQQ